MDYESTEKDVGRKSRFTFPTGTCGKNEKQLRTLPSQNLSSLNFWILLRIRSLIHFALFSTNRSLVQIKSHAQKVIKRYDNGEDVFLRLDENIVRTEAVVAQIHDQMKNEGIPIPPAPGLGIARERKVKMVDVREQIVAASALCQLSQPTPSPLPPLTTTTGHSSSFKTHAVVSSKPVQIRNIVLGSSSNVVKL